MGNDSTRPSIGRRNYLKLASVVPTVGVSGLASGDGGESEREDGGDRDDTPGRGPPKGDGKRARVASFPFDAGSGAELTETVTGTTHELTEKPWGRPYWLSGIEDESLLFEGYATYLRSESNSDLKPLPGRYNEYHDVTNGEAGLDRGNLTIVAGTNTDVWETADRYSSVYIENGAEEQSTITTRVVSQENTSIFAKAGIVVRNRMSERGQSLGYANVLVTPERGFSMQWDLNANGTSGGDWPPIQAGTSQYPAWLRLEKSGTTFTGSFSYDGKSWNEMATAELPNANSVQDVGLFATSLNPIDRSRVEFDHFEVENN